MKPKPQPQSQFDPTESEIQHTAYLLWIEDGRPEGRNLEHWHAAKEWLQHAHGRDASTGRRSVVLAKGLAPSAELGIRELASR